MTDVLTRIVERKREEVAARPAIPGSVEPTHRSLRKALAKPGARFIMEVKRRSPSGHVSRHGAAEAVEAYRPVADAISVLTDEANFGGSLDDLRLVRQRFDGPILAKDFIVHPCQVAEARAAGADSVLAMLSVLGDADAAAVMAEAARLAMDVVVEVHGEGELRRALALGAKIIGINNRNLRTLETDLSVTESLAPAVPDNVLLLSESGIAAHRDVVRLSRSVDGFLVGSSLMAAPDLNEAARALVHGRVKICGLAREEDVVLAAGAGATHAGFILVRETPRAVPSDGAIALAGTARSLGLKPVGVFRDQPVEEIAACARLADFAAVQLHGNEDDDAVVALRALLPSSTEIWASCGVSGNDVPAGRMADRIVFDTLLDGRSGGTGLAFDWTKVAEDPRLKSAFLAGGIGPENATRAAALGAYGLDLSSGVESAPGEKDPVRVAALFAALRPESRIGR